MENEHYSATKKKEILPFAKAWVDLESIMLSGISQSEKRQVSYDFSHMGNLKNKMKQQAKQRQAHREQAG